MVRVNSDLPAMCTAVVAHAVAAVTALAVVASAQHRVWLTGQPSAGGFYRETLAVIGDRDGDGWDDVVRTVGIPLWPGAPWYDYQAWVYSGRTGGLLTMGPSGAIPLVRAGDFDHDGVADYLIGAAGAWLPLCAPWICAAFEVHSGRNDSLLWRVDLQGANALGSMTVGDLDLNGDGTPDALIGTNIGPPSPYGLVYAISRGTVLYQITGQPGAPFAPGISKFIDYNHDGCDDFLLGIYQAPNGAIDIRSGRDGSVLRRLLCPPKIWGYGSTAAMTGDLDGDGVADVIAGDSGPFTEGAIAVLGSVTGALIHRWQVNPTGTVGRDNFGWPFIASTDVDRDGMDDVIASAATGNAGQYIFSGRDGSLIERYDPPPPDWVGVAVAALPPQAGDPFPRYAAHGGTGLTSTSTNMFSGAPDGVDLAGVGAPGTLAQMPILGLRELLPSGFRVTLAGAEPSSFALLVIGFNATPGPFASLGPAGFPGCVLYPQPDIVGFEVTGSTWPDIGYAAHDFPGTLVPAGTAGSFTAYVQWVVFGGAATWPGGVSEAMRIHVR